MSSATTKLSPRAVPDALPLLDVGAATVELQPSVRQRRADVIRAQGGRCANEACRRTAPSFDVVTTESGKLIAFCRSCRLRWDAPRRHEKARERRALGVQLRLPGTTRCRQRVVLPDAQASVAEAIRSLRGPVHVRSAEAGAWALIATLRGLGFMFTNDERTETRAR